MSALALPLGSQLIAGSIDASNQEGDSLPLSPIRHLPSLLPAMSGINAQDVASYWTVRKRAMSPDVLDGSGTSFEEGSVTDNILALDASFVQSVKVRRCTEFPIAREQIEERKPHSIH
jgi:hypothetical protein